MQAYQWEDTDVIWIKSNLSIQDPAVYLDSIGQARATPNELKARNEILAGLKSIFIWPAVGKNIEWINYLYYNQQKFLTCTGDALKALREQVELPGKGKGDLSIWLTNWLINMFGAPVLHKLVQRLL